MFVFLLALRNKLGNLEDRGQFVFKIPYLQQGRYQVFLIPEVVLQELFFHSNNGLKYFLF